MKQSSYKGKSPLPDFVIDAACAGNAEGIIRAKKSLSDDQIGERWDIDGREESSSKSV